MGRVAVTYGTNAIPAVGGTTDSSRVKFATNATPMPGSGASLPTKSAVVQEDHVGCAGTTKSGGSCKARPAKGTEWCIGHLRSLGEDY